ncbi:MAG: hypothetical protein AB7G28_25880 [Pirellulales bacterium]
MTGITTATGYRQTKQKLAGLEERLSRLEDRTDLNREHLAASQHSYKKMIAQYRRELKLYEAAHPESTTRP